MPALDIIVYIYVVKDEDTSYAAHGGGLVAGFLLGLALLNPVADSRCHTWCVRPLAALLLVARKWLAGSHFLSLAMSRFRERNS